LPEPGIEPGTSCIQSGCVTTAPPSQLRVSIVVKPFNGFDAMGRNVNKQFESHICGPDIFNKYIFSVISTVGPPSGPKVEFRLNTSTHVLRALKRTTFCQGMQLKKYGHFGTGTNWQNPRSYQNVWYPAF